MLFRKNRFQFCGQGRECGQNFGLFSIKKIFFDEKNEMYILIWGFLLYLGEEFHAFYHFFGKR